MNSQFGLSLRQKLDREDITCFIGVYDVFSASIVARYYDSIFISGFSFAASHYGLPDIGFTAWSDLLGFVQRVRAMLPHHHLLVDIDDGFGDPEVACHIVSLMEMAGASGVIIEDQKRPRRCGHFDGKQLLEIEEFVVKLTRVLAARRDLFVVARTDATDDGERIKRAQAFAESGADAILLEAVQDLSLIRKLKTQIKQPFMVNQIEGGKSPIWSLSELQRAGVPLVNYSTPCLFAAQDAIEESMERLKNNNGLLPNSSWKRGGVPSCTSVLYENLAMRDKR